VFLSAQIACLPQLMVLKLRTVLSARETLRSPLIILQERQSRDVSAVAPSAQTFVFATLVAL
jgi:hypothetical protein